MARDYSTTRRRVMRLTGGTAVSTLVAGCMGGGPRRGGPGGGGSDDGGGVAEIEPGSDIEFSAQTSHWEGLAPSSIEGLENPTLVLQAGEDYTIGWTQGDGGGHNIEIRDETDAVVDNLSTEVVSDPDEDQILAITASSEMALYVCDPHQNTMRGDIRIE